MPFNAHFSGAVANLMGRSCPATVRGMLQMGVQHKEAAFHGVNQSSAGHETFIEFGIRIPQDFVLVSKALTTFEGTCLSIDPDINIIEHLRTFVRKHVTKGLDFDDALKQLKAGPFEMRRLNRLVVKHGARALKFLENPTIRISGEGGGAVAGGGDTTGLNIAYGFIIAALILFAALLGNGSELEQWLRSFLPLPRLPILPLVSLACAAGLWLSLVFRNRRTKGTRISGR